MNLLRLTVLTKYTQSRVVDLRLEGNLVITISSLSQLTKMILYANWTFIDLASPWQKW